MNSQHSPNAPDESLKAERIINEALVASTGVISHATARLVAAALYQEPNGALQRFAASGQFDIDTLEHETAHLMLPTGRESWRQALLDFLRSKRSTHPWSRSAVRSPGAHRPPKRDETHNKSPEQLPLSPRNTGSSEVQWEGNEPSKMSQFVVPHSLATPRDPSLVITVPEAAERLRVSHWTIYRLMREGRLKTIQIGSRRLIPLASLRKFVDHQSEQGTTGDA